MDSDPVKRPAHYRTGEVEAIDIIEQITRDYPPELAYMVGNVLKYVIRAPHKGKLSEDLAKADWYLRRATNRSINLKPRRTECVHLECDHRQKIAAP
jgi:hypothetical protein